jgi:8-oxo-dGTP diphosphatase
VQRVAAYAVIIRDGQILLSRLAPHISRDGLWTLPGGGVEHGEDPRDAVVREVREETSLEVRIGETAHTFSLHLPDTWRKGRRVDAHSLRIVYEGWVPPDSPPPRVLEVDGSTVEAAWQPLEGVLDGSVPTVALVKEALAAHRPHRLQRVAAYALVVRDSPERAVLLTRNSVRGPHPGQWSLPGGGIEHGEDPRDAVVREVAEETGLTAEVGEVVIVDNVRLRGTAPSGRDEELHSVGIVYDAKVPEAAEPRVVEAEGTTDEAAWVSLADVRSGAVPTYDTVRRALAARLPQ